MEEEEEEEEEGGGGRGREKKRKHIFDHFAEAEETRQMTSEGLTA